MLDSALGIRDPAVSTADIVLGLMELTAEMGECGGWGDL